MTSSTRPCRLLNLRSMLMTLLALLLITASVDARQPTILQQLHQLTDTSLLVEDDSGQQLHQFHAHQSLIPASTLKLLTAYAALKTWGPEHRFHTDFFLDHQNRLLIRGYGDPFIVSEEMDLIVKALAQKGLSQLNGIVIDSSYFCDKLNIDGQSDTDNPYDASPGALASNFNTIFIRKTSRGLTSAEPQTPLTDIATQQAVAITTGKHRINLGRQSDGAMYFAELLEAKLLAKKIKNSGEIIRTTLSGDLTLFYRHYNSRTLAKNISGMLEYSNNFIANQLFLLLGAEIYGAPASMNKSRMAIKQFIDHEFEWKNHLIFEGAGLSRKNRLTTQQLIDVLNKLKPYAHLLPVQNSQIIAKTGTLQQVSSYAGYIRNHAGLNSFALIINQQVDPDFRFRVAESLAAMH